VAAPVAAAVRHAAACLLALSAFALLSTGAQAQAGEASKPAPMAAIGEERSDRGEVANARADEESTDDDGPEDSWGDDSWSDDDWDAAPSTLWSGFVEAALSLRTGSEPLFDERATRAELRARIEASRAVGSAQLSGILDLHADAVDDGLWLDLREALATLPLGTRANFKLGRQVLTWGTGDLIFINDRFPKDYRAPLAGAPDLDFKAPSNSARLAWNLGALNLDLAYTPRLAPDRHIDGERLGFYDFGSQRRIGGEDLIHAREPSGFNAGELALRLHRNRQGVEYAAYLYRGFDKQPLGLDLAGQPSHFRRDAAGFSIRGPLAGGIFSMEAGREWSGAELQNVLARVPHKTSVLIGFEREWLPKLTLGAQAYSEFHAQEPGNASPLNGQERHLMSLRISHQALRDRLTTSAIAFYSPNQHDRWLRVTVSHRLSDQWLTGATANLFGGRVDRFFGQLEDDSNAGVWVRRQF
jgi:hypothetical protein